MNPFLTREMAQQHVRDLLRAAKRRRPADEYGELDESELTVRSFQPSDQDAVRVLAALEGRHLPDGPALVAEVDREVVAALPLDGGAPLADPFRRTAEAIALLELRARQLRSAA